MDIDDVPQFAPTPIKIVFADDSETVRRLLSLIISADPAIEMCEMAKNGREAVVRTLQQSPDVVLLDIEMPVMDGIEATIAIRKLNPRVPVIVFSTLATDGGRATLDALAHGATDYVLKPSVTGKIDDSIDYLRNELLPKIKRWGRWFQCLRQSRTAPSLPSVGISKTNGRQQLPTAIPSNRKSDQIDVVGIGVSTGGPNALARVLRDVSTTFPVPILITQHMPADFTRLLAQRLDHICPLTVREGVRGAVVERGQVWIAPGDQHMEVRRVGASVHLELHRGPPENSCRPSVDVLFRSMAAVYRQRALTVVMTGMGQDGMLGCRAIAEQGGRILAQDEASSVVWGMPRAVVHAGLADEVLTLNDIAPEMHRYTAVGRIPSARVPSTVG